MKEIAKDIYLIQIKNKGESDRFVGVIKHAENKCILIDTGADELDAKRIIKELDKHLLKPEIIINTHAHADHFGGNNYIQKITNAKVLASELEKEIISCPKIEGYLFNSGAIFPKELITKKKLAKKSIVQESLEINKTYLIGNKKIKIVGLPGHTPNHIAIEIDKVLFCSDCILADSDIKKHKIPFYQDIDKIKTTLKRLKEMKGRLFILSHYGATSDIKKHIIENEMVLNNLEKVILLKLKLNLRKYVFHER